MAEDKVVADQTKVDLPAQAGVPAKFEKLVGEIEKMPIVELAELVKVLENKFGVSAAAPAMAAAGPAAAPAVPVRAAAPSSSKLTPEERKTLKETMEDLFGTRGACIFDEKMNVLGKVPLSELSSTIKSLNGGIHALVMDGVVDLDLVRLAEKLNIKHVMGTGNKVKEATHVNIIAE